MAIPSRLRRNSPGSWPRLSSISLPASISHLPGTGAGDLDPVTAPFVGDAFLKSVIDGWRTNLNDLEKNFRKIRRKAKKYGKRANCSGDQEKRKKGAPRRRDAPVEDKGYIFSSSRVLATAAADFSNRPSSSALSFKGRIFSMPPAPRITGTPKKMSFKPYSPSR